MEYLEEYPLHVQVALALGWREIEQDGLQSWVGIPLDWPKERREYHIHDTINKAAIPLYGDDGTEGWAVTGKYISGLRIRLFHYETTEVGTDSGWHASVRDMTIVDPHSPTSAIAKLLIKIAYEGSEDIRRKLHNLEWSKPAT